MDHPYTVFPCLCMVTFLIPALALAGETSGQKTAGQPNIVFVVADDLGYNDVGYHGSEIHTPTIDALAASGVKLENYYVQPCCTPSRSQIMSGRYQIHTGLQHYVLQNGQANGLPLDSPTLADKLKEAGYDTHMVGKWHLGFYKDEYLPWNRGFDTFFGYLGGQEDYYNHSKTYNDWGSFLDFRDQNGPLRSEDGFYSGHLFTTKAIEIVRGHDQKKPLFLYLAYQSVHKPLQVPDYYLTQYEFIKHHDRKVYAGMTSVLDEGLTNLTQALRDSGLWDNTVFIFTTDNGGMINYGGNNYPLRGGKFSLWEGGVHGVGFVAGGVVKPKEAVNRELIHVSDWFPTLVTLAGGNLNGTMPLDGFDQWETINNVGTPSKRNILLHNIDPLTMKKGEPLYNDTWDTSVRAAIRMGDYKLITGDPGNGNCISPPGGAAGISEELDEPSQKNVWLFNITADPTEHYDLSEQLPDVVLQMLDLLQDINKTSVPARFPPDDPRSDPRLHGGVWGPWE